VGFSAVDMLSFHMRARISLRFPGHVKDFLSPDSCVGSNKRDWFDYLRLFPVLPLGFRRASNYFHMPARVEVQSFGHTPEGGYVRRRNL
jgi:hypothetical protein